MQVYSGKEWQESSLTFISSSGMDPEKQTEDGHEEDFIFLLWTFEMSQSGSLRTFSTFHYRKVTMEWLEVVYGIFSVSYFCAIIAPTRRDNKL